MNKPAYNELNHIYTERCEWKALSAPSSVEGNLNSCVFKERILGKRRTYQDKFPYLFEFDILF